MKALSIRQPWAWLIANGYKDIENRDWPTKFRGKFLIHTDVRIDEPAITEIKYLHPDIILPESYKIGGIIGEAEIVDCISTSDSEWFFGEFGFVIQNAKLLPFRPYRGMLGFFEVAE